MGDQEPARGAGGEPRGIPGRRRDRAIALVAGASRGAVAAHGLVPVRLLAIRLLAMLKARLDADLAAEARSGRLILWLPAAFALGILIYFAAPREPMLLAGPLLTLAFAGIAVIARARPAGFALMLVLASAAAGFSVATLRTAAISHPVAPAPAMAVRLTGHVERVERRPGGDRILLRVEPGEVRGLGPAPELVRITLRRGWAPPVGSRITQLVRLLPPLGPALPGGHDFGRGPWFRGIGAVGYGLGRPVAAGPGPVPVEVRIATVVDAMRQSLAGRIRASLGGIEAEIAVALVSGERAGIPRAVEDGMRVSGLTHILSISGLHMALVAGTLFFLIRGALALAPALALGAPIKSLAAGAALAGSAIYLVLSGNDVPAQRSFVMAALVLAGILAGRPALTLRTVAVAAVVVLTLTPEAALEAGTQMSFAATLALVAAYERLRPLRVLPHPSGIAAWAGVKVLVFLGGIAFTALVAGLASAPYGAFHFQRLAPYGLLANLLAMPAVSLVVMPAGLLAVLLIPFGLDGLLWPLMGQGISVMVAVSDHIAALPGADLRTDAIGAGALGLLSLSLLAVCLLRGSLAGLAVVPLGLAVLLMGPGPRPDVLIGADATTVAVRGDDGRLSVLGPKSQRLMVEQWLGREADRRSADARDLAAAFACDPLGCVAPLPGGGTIAVSHRPESLEADCLNARIVVTRDAPPANCPARVFTPAELARTGTVALHRDGESWKLAPTRAEGRDRPWMPYRPPPPAATDDAGPPDAAIHDAGSE